MGVWNFRDLQGGFDKYADYCRLVRVQTGHKHKHGSHSHQDLLLLRSVTGTWLCYWGHDLLKSTHLCSNMRHAGGSEDSIRQSQGMPGRSFLQNECEQSLQSCDTM